MSWYFHEWSSQMTIQKGTWWHAWMNIYVFMDEYTFSSLLYIPQDETGFLTSKFGLLTRK